jgi:hypothetical protein
LLVKAKGSSDVGSAKEVSVAFRDALENQRFLAGHECGAELRRRRHVKLAYAMFAISVFTLVAFSLREALLGTAAAALGISATIFFIGRSRDVADRIFWEAAAFAFFFLGSVSLPAAWMLPHAVGIVLLIVCGALATVAAATPFCLGRFVYVLLFRRAARPA